MGQTADMSNKLDDSAAVELTGKIMVAAIICLFLVVVIVMFLHLYAKWFWWCGGDSAHFSRTGRSRRRRFVFAPGQEQTAAALRRGLDPTVLKSFPVLVFRPDEFKEGLECAVCLSEVVDGEKARLLPKCNHGFHVECIDMWFQSHSTCPLCRNSVGPPPPESPNSVALDFIDSSVSTSSSEDDSGRGGGGYSTEVPNFPTNVLFWGNQTQISSGPSCLDEGPSSSSSTTTNRAEGILVIDIPRQTAAEIFSPRSPAEYRNADGETKSPMPTRMRSFKRLLSRDRRMVASSPSSVDIEQGS